MVGTAAEEDDGAASGAEEGGVYAIVRRKGEESGELTGSRTGGILVPDVDMVVFCGSGAGGGR